MILMLLFLFPIKLIPIDITRWRGGYTGSDRGFEMRKISFICLSIFLILLTACSPNIENEDDNTSIEEPVKPDEDTPSAEPSTPPSETTPDEEDKPSNPGTENPSTGNEEDNPPEEETPITPPEEETNPEEPPVTPPEEEPKPGEGEEPVNPPEEEDPVTPPEEEDPNITEQDAKNCVTIIDIIDDVLFTKEGDFNINDPESAKTVLKLGVYVTYYRYMGQLDSELSGEMDIDVLTVQEHFPGNGEESFWGPTYRITGLVKVIKGEIVDVSEA